MSELADLSKDVASNASECELVERDILRLDGRRDELDVDETAALESALRILRVVKERIADFEQRLERLAGDPEGDRLRCSECGRLDVGDRGWTMRVGEDDELYPFCAECDRREFKGGEA